MNKTNTKLLLMQRFAQWLNETVQEEETGITPEEIAKEAEEAEAPNEVYTLQDGTILNVYDDKTIEPQLEDGVYEVEENDEQNVVIKDGLFSGWEDKPQPTAEPIEDLPIAQEAEQDEPQEDEKDAEIESLKAENESLKAEIESLKAQLEGKEGEIEEMKKQPSIQKAEAKRVTEEGKDDQLGRMVQMLNKKMR